MILLIIRVAVEETILSIKSAYPGLPILALFEPHSATSRSKIFQEQFTKGLEHADEAYITTLARGTSAKNSKDLNPQEMISDLKSKGIHSSLIESCEDIVKLIQDKKSEPGVLLIMSNGTAKGFWESDFVKNLS